MISIIKYVTLYLKEYVDYIFDNLESMDNISKARKEDIKKNLMSELNKTLFIFVNSFNPTISYDSTTLMKKSNELIEENDREHKINAYEIFLEGSKILIEAYDDTFALSIIIGEKGQNKINIYQTFSLSKYLKTKDFNTETEAYTPNENTYYLKLSNGKILIYNKEVIDKIRLTGLDRNVVSFPSNIYVVGDSQEFGFFNFVSGIYESMKAEKDMQKGR